MHIFKDRSANREVVLDDGNVNLYADSILGFSIEPFDLNVDGVVLKSEVFRLHNMGDCYIYKIPETLAAYMQSKHLNQLMVSVRHRPTLGSVVVLGKNLPNCF